MPEISDFDLLDEIETTFGTFIVLGIDLEDKTLLIKKLSDIIDEIKEKRGL